MAIDLNPTIFGKKLFPSSERVMGALGNAAQSLGQAAQGFGSALTQSQFGINPALSVPAAIAATRQTASQTPLLGTGPMFGLRGGQQPAAQPTQPAFDYGTFAATRGLPAFDVTKTQTPSATQNQINTAALTGQTSPLNFSTQSPFSAPKAIPTQSTPMAGFARVSDWSQNPLVQAARATGNISAIERATAQAKSQGRGVFQPNDISAVSLASLRASNPEAGFGGSRTPAQQQALLAQMRIRGAETMSKNLAEQEKIIAQRRANPELYATPAGGMIAPPTNMFGRPIAEFQQRYAQRERGIQNQAATNTSMLASTGFGRMQQDFQKQTEFGMGRSPLYRGMGISSAVTGGPQPSSPMLANNTMNQRSRMFQTI